MAEIKDERDLLHPFLNKRKFDEFSREQEDGEIELSLGLSLNGRFGIDPTRPENPPLVRSSSVSSFVFTADATEAELGRTCSMPPEWQRRKEAQSVRRLEAKRKRVEKTKDRRMGERHVSVGSQGSGSSSAGSGSELQVSSIPVEARNPGSDHSPRKKKKTRAVEGAKLDKRSTKSTNHNAKEEKMKNMMMDMPCVSTQGLGPSGKRIQGFLYRYRKGEEVRIVCVCHGSFLTPAEFVKHAGGDDVLHPLKHIVVNPSPLL